MLGDIRSYLLKNPKTNAPKIETCNSKNGHMSPKKSTEKIKSNKNKRKVIESDSDSERECFVKKNKKTPSPQKKREQLKEVNVSVFLGSGPIRRVKAKEIPIKLQEKEDGIHEDEDFDKTLLQLDLTSIDTQIKSPVKIEPHVDLDDSISCIDDSICTSQSSPNRKPNKTKTPSSAKGRKRKHSQTETEITDEERHLRKRHHAMQYKSWKNRPGPEHLGSKQVPEGSPDCLIGCVFVITGVLDSFEREEIVDIVKRHSGEVKSGISKKVTHMICGRDAGQAKVAKAEELNVKIISEDEFLDMIKDKESPKKSTRSETPNKNRAMSESPITTRSKSKTPIKIDTKDEFKTRPQSKTPVKDFTKGESTIKSRSQSKTPVKTDTKDASVFKTRSQSKTPVKDFTKSESTIKSRSQSKTPVKTDTKDASVFKTRSQSKTPVKDFTKCESTLKSKYQSKTDTKHASMFKTTSKSKTPTKGRSPAAKKSSKIQTPAKGRSSAKKNKTPIKDGRKSSTKKGETPAKKSKKSEHDSATEIKDESQIDTQPPEKSYNLSFTEKYRPTTFKQIIGQQGEASCASKLSKWLSKWYQNRKVKHRGANPWSKGDGGYYKAALLCGPPGVGKTTTANIVCKELGFDVIEFNASDTRSKTLLKDKISELTKTNTLFGYMHGKKSVTKKHAIIMDEVDGMAGNEDRGGMQELLALIKDTSIPIVCICNDKTSMKMRSLVTNTFDLTFSRPKLPQIKGALSSICFKEGIKISPDSLNEIITGASQDMRQILNLLSMWSINDKNLSSDSVSRDSKLIKKDMKMGPWTVLRSVFTEEEQKNMSIYDKSDLFFHDYSLAPLFVQQNYLKVVPHCPEEDVLDRFAETANSLSIGDLVEAKIRGSMAWTLLPVQAMFSSVIPGALLSGHINGTIDFPTWLGQNSRQNKLNRLVQEINSHTKLSTSGSKQSIRLDYAKHIRDAILKPLSLDGLEAVDGAVQVLESYHLLREDMESLEELTNWHKGVHIKDTVIDSKVKSALTRRYNKTAAPLPYSQVNVKKSKAQSKESGRDEVMDSDDEGEEADEADNSDIENDAMIKKSTKPKKESSDSKESKKRKNNKKK